MSGVLAFGFPNPFDLLGSAADAVLGAPASMANDMFRDGVAWVVESVLGALVELSVAVLGFFWDAAEPDVGASWFSGSDSTMYGQMVVMTLPLLLVFLLVGIIHGVIKGDAAGMARMAFLRLPGAVLAMGITIAITDVLVDVTDEMSRSVLGGSRPDVEAVTEMLSQVAATDGLTGPSQMLLIVFGLVGLVAAVLLVIELFVRAGLIYIVVALSPLIYAATVWESMRGAVRKMAEIGLALILSKFVIALALSLSAAALASAGSSSSGATEVATPEQAAGAVAGGAGLAQTVGVLVGAVVMFGIAAFMPFVLFKLLPIAEGALVAQGIKSGPMRAAQQGRNAQLMARHSPASSAMRGRAGGGTGGRAGSGGATAGSGAGGSAAAGPAAAMAVAGVQAAKKVATDATKNMTAAADTPSGGENASRNGRSTSTGPSESGPSSRPAPDARSDGARGSTATKPRPTGGTGR